MDSKNTKEVCRKQGRKPKKCVVNKGEQKTQKKCVANRGKKDARRETRRCARRETGRCAEIKCHRTTVHFGLNSEMDCFEQSCVVRYNIHLM